MARIRDAEVELPRGDLAAILRDAVPDCVEVELANSVQALIQDADGVTAEFAGPEADYLEHLGVYVATLPLDGGTGADLVM